MPTKHVSISGFGGNTYYVGTVNLVDGEIVGGVDVLVQVDGNDATARVVRDRLQYAMENGIN